MNRGRGFSPPYRHNSLSSYSHQKTWVIDGDDDKDDDDDDDDDGNDYDDSDDCSDENIAGIGIFQNILE